MKLELDARRARVRELVHGHLIITCPGMEDDKQHWPTCDNAVEAILKTYAELDVMITLRPVPLIELTPGPATPTPLFFRGETSPYPKSGGDT